MYGYSAELSSLRRQQDSAALALHGPDVPSFSFPSVLETICACPYALQQDRFGRFTATEMQGNTCLKQDPQKSKTFAPRLIAKPTSVTCAVLSC